MFKSLQISLKYTFELYLWCIEKLMWLLKMFYKIDFIAKELCFAYQTVIGLQFIGFAAD